MEKKQILKYIKDKNIKLKNKKELEYFLKSTPDLYSRKNKEGHITTSAFILDSKEEKILLIYNPKFNKWLQPGGHIDKKENSYIAVLREIEEEVGIKDIIFKEKNIFDIDIHKIPFSLKKQEAEHWHFDIRYLCKAPENFNIKTDKNEVSAYEWVKITDLIKTNDISLKRIAKKIINKQNEKKLVLNKITLSEAKEKIEQYKFYHNQKEIGYINLKFFDKNNDKIIQLKNIFIYKEYRKQGYGSYIINNLKKRYDDIILEIWDNSLLDFYQRLGFDYAGGPEDLGWSKKEELKKFKKRKKNGYIYR